MYDVAPSAVTTSPKGFQVEELYDLQRRQGKLKPPAMSYNQRNSLKKKLTKQDRSYCSIVRFVSHIYQDYGRLLKFL